MRAIKYLFQFILSLAVLGIIIGTVSMVGLYLYFSPSLPDVETLKEIKFQTPLKVFSKDQKLIAEFGEKRRTPIVFAQIPTKFVRALQAAEDSRYFEHNGVDIKGLARAVVQLATTGKKQGGGSTITMQVAKNFFLTREKSFSRKFSEILLALKIENSLTKEEIFELYINKIYLGHRSYGIQAAAYVYYGKDINDISLAQLAMIAGLPKAPSAFNPITNPSRAIERRNWIIGRMLTLGYIDKAEHDKAYAQPVTAFYHTADIELYAPYVAEMVRKKLYKQFGNNIYTDGLTVTTTIDSKMQSSANDAVQNGLLAYVKRHGYRGPEKQFDISALSTKDQLKLVKAETTHADLEPALVLEVSKKEALVLRKNGETVTLAWEGLSWARRFKTVNSMGPKPTSTANILKIGDLVRIKPKLDKEQMQHWELSQIPKVQGAMVAMAPKNGAILSLVGGFSFSHNKFNRATQALRQPGSNLKPFIYGAALESGYTAATTINDAPIVLQGASLQANWRPENSSRKFYGPTRLRVGLYKSRNLVSIRLLRAIGIDNALDYLAKFGFDRDKLPTNLSLSLGAVDITPLDLIQGYGPFANGGYRIDTHFIDRITNQEGEVVFQEKPRTVISESKPLPEHYTQAPRVIDARDGYVIYSILKDVIRRGTATKARVLKRSDLAGKTGTTNLQRDAWFTGFNSEIVATAWVGYDNPAPLGKREFGGTAALPIWIDFMRETLANMPEAPLKRPPGLIDVRVHPTTGLRSRAAGSVTEMIKSEDAQRLAAQSAEINDSTTDDLFN
ncbi:MAG: penicillin-binding protein 1A [Oceanospirillaceae bacterium]|nr:penicillin-binding protein 1A [Oceanospirillaceae bacterium]